MPRSRLEAGQICRDRFGSSLGFELLPMFDLPDFEENLQKNLDLFSAGPLIFHEPVWGVEHTALKGTLVWEESMRHLRKTQHYAEILHPEIMVCHLNNCVIPPENRGIMLRTALKNLEELQLMFPGVKLLVENTGIRADGTMLLDQKDFTVLCRSYNIPVLIDLGHANANGWNIRKLITDLKDLIGGFHLHNNDGAHDLHQRLGEGTIQYEELIPWICSTVPDVPMVIEYTREDLCGEPLLEDIGTLKRLVEEAEAAQGLEVFNQEKEAENDPNWFAESVKERIQYVFDTMDDAICLAGRHGELRYMNVAARELFGIKNIAGTKLWDAIPFVEGNDELIQLFINSVMTRRKSMHSLVNYVNNDGKVFNLHVSVTCESGDNPLILVVISNLTELMKVHSAFARYTSPEIANYVLSTPDGTRQGGQVKNVSILMSDLRGFTALSTQLSSTDLLRMLNRYFEQMSMIIQRFRGTIIEFLGDGIFVVFGAPEDHAGHASAAVRCAIEMQNAMASVNAWNREQDYPELEMGIGINSGLTVVGNIGSETRMKYGCLGETVNLAGRLESMTVGGQIYISENTRILINEALTITEERSIMPKGGRAEMKIYSVAGIEEDQILSNSNAVEWIWLSTPKKITFYKLNRKMVVPGEYGGRMLRISTDARYGILSTGEPLDPLANLMFRLEEQDVYAKVLNQEKDGYRLCFTFHPADMLAMLERVT